LNSENQVVNSLFYLEFAIMILWKKKKYYDEKVRQGDYKEKGYSYECALHKYDFQ